jgi:hypothetical protein
MGFLYLNSNKKLLMWYKKRKKLKYFEINVFFFKEMK